MLIANSKDNGIAEWVSLNNLLDLIITSGLDLFIFPELDKPSHVYIMTYVGRWTHL